MSSKILSVSEKTRRQFLQQKITYRDPNSVGSSLVVSVLSARENIGIVAGMYESKSIFGGIYYLTVLVYTKTTIHLSVGGNRWIFTSPLRGSVNIHH